jgi:glycosyltransferase involved in cell wall biosynthesis
VILTVKEGVYEPYLALDPTLGARLPAGLPTVRTTVFRGLTPLLTLQGRLKARLRGRPAPAAAVAAAPAPPASGARPRGLAARTDLVTECFEIPDEEMGWILPGVLAGLRAARREDVSAVYATGRPWSGLLIGWLIARLTGRPLVTDFRDPWMTNPFRPAYSAVKERAEARLERLVVEGSALVVANTEHLRDEFRARFPGQPAAKFTALLNGYDPDDFPEPVRGARGAVLTLTHTGFLYGKRDPRTFLAAVRRAVESGAVPAAGLRVRFVGPAELPYAPEALAAEAGLQAAVRFEGRVSFAESLARIAEADALLLLQPGTTTQVPSKLFEYIGMGKPILALSPPGGATARLVAEEGLGEVADPEDVPAIAEALRRLYLAWREGRLRAPGAAVRQKFNVKHLTGILAGHLDGLATPAASRNGRRAWTQDPIA